MMQFRGCKTFSSKGKFSDRKEKPSECSDTGRSNDLHPVLSVSPALSGGHSPFSPSKTNIF